MKLRHLAEVKNSNVDKIVQADEIAVRLCNYVDVYRNDFIENGMPFSAGSATRAEIESFRLRPGDVVITKDSEDRLDIGVPALVRSSAEDLVCGYHLTILRPDHRRVRGDFLFWALQSRQTRDAFSNAAFGVTRFGLSLGAMKNIAVHLPDLATQKSIADFLDRETARIDGLIGRRNRFEALLPARLEALVHLGREAGDTIWRRFEHAAHRVMRPVVLSEQGELVRLGLYNRGRGIFTKPAADEDGMGVSDFFFVEAGDLVVSGQFAWEGAVALVGEEHEGCVVSHRYPVYRGVEGVSTGYLLAFLRSREGDFLLNEASRGSAGRNRPLNTWRLGKEMIPVPPPSIQGEIDRVLRTERQLKRLNQFYVERLLEHRSALITAAVTGRIDPAKWHRRGGTERALDRIAAEVAE